MASDFNWKYGGLPYFAMKGSRIMCSLFTFPTPVHIGDAMFIY